MARLEDFLRHFLTHEADLKAFIRSLVRDHRDYDDICQSAALALWRKFETYDETRPFGAWARGVAANEVLAARRADGRRPTPFSEEVVSSILLAFDRDDSSERNRSNRMLALERCLEELPDSSKKMIELRYKIGLSILEIATTLARTPAATQRAIARIRDRLAECIERRLSTAQGE